MLATHATVNSRSLIKVQLGNFPPNSRATLNCEMFGELTYEKLMEAFVFRLPLTYVPRYLFGNKATPSELKAAEDTDFNKASIDGGKQTSWNIKVNVNKTDVGYLTEVISRTHPINVVDGDEATKVSIDFDNFSPDKVATRDFEIYLKEVAMNVPNAQMAETLVNGKKYTSLMVNYLPLIGSDEATQKAV